jgi:hypothetical protein
MWHISSVSAHDSTSTLLAAARPSTIRKKVYGTDDLEEHEW